ncbi:uncharacterized protein LOC107274564 isoform X2 [Cephus cinctus]|uniref:Uncharacterized protein LOC107274564 isoform X2 n=1 Tax=Cephus cinctus TaxID=211228 RepID=A0AAJ7FUU1_CEPCN|nr:uncharacterized protein LOC107274564 isoform X2 [Cephus cinctus]
MTSLRVLILLGILAVVIVAEEPAPSAKQALEYDDDYDDDYDIVDLTSKKGPHPLKHKHKYPFSLLGGGLKSLAIFLAIKIKIILIVVAVIGIIGFTLKVFGGLKYAGYFNKDCPVIHEPAYGLGYSAPPPEEHNEHYASYESDWSPTENYARSFIDNYIDTNFVYRILKSMDMAELMFNAMEIESDQCRKRFVCEMDKKTEKIPVLKYAMQFFSYGLEKYRVEGKDIKFNECAKLYSECEDANKESTTRRRRKRRTVGRVRKVIGSS